MRRLSLVEREPVPVGIDHGIAAQADGVDSGLASPGVGVVGENGAVGVYSQDVEDVAGSSGDHASSGSGAGEFQFPIQREVELGDDAAKDLKRNFTAAVAMGATSRAAADYSSIGVVSGRTSLSG